MAIDPTLLVTSEALEEVLFDKATGLPLSAGIITFYEDDNRTVLKNIYMQQGTSGSYTYSLLANPMTLNADGSTSDSSGNNVKIFYYPYDESAVDLTKQAYFITVYNSVGTFQFSRSNFPFEPDVTPPATSVATLENYIVNGRFWRNIAVSPATINVSAPANTVLINGLPNYYTTLAPSQHDGFTMSDIVFLKNDTGGSSNDVISFGLFPQQTTTPVLTNDITPEYYLDFQCTATGGDTYKCIQFPISLHLLTLGAAQNCTVTFQAKAISGSNVSIVANILAFAGTGVSTSVTQTKATFPIGSSAWQKYSISFQMPPSLAQASLGEGGDDAFYLQLGLPSGGAGICEIQIAVPQFYVSADVPTNSFETYDEVASIANSPRTGDIRFSLNSFQPFGWIAMDNSTIGNAASAATRPNRDTWPLYNLLWNAVNDAFAPVSTGRGSSAYGDYSLAKTLTLTSALGRTLIGLPIAVSVTSYTAGSAPAWNPTVNGFFTVPSNLTLYQGMPVILTGTTLNAAFTSGTLYYAIPAFDGTTTQFQLATTYANAILGTAIPASGVLTGTAIVVTPTLGGTIGEDEHVQLVDELALHHHLPTGTPNSGTPAFVVDKTTGTVTLAGGGTTTSTQPTTGNTGSSHPFNVVQPSLLTNIYIKL